MNGCAKRRVSPRVRREAAYQAAWEDLVRRFHSLLHGQVRRSLQGAGLAVEAELVEERVQEVYYRLLLGGKSRLRLLRRWSEGQLVRYLSRVAQGVVVDEVRARAAAKRGGCAWSPSAAGLSEIAEEAVDPHGTPEEQAMVAEHRRLLLARCRFIADSMMTDWTDRGRCLRILRLALIEGWSSQEIARAEGGLLAASTVDSLVHRVRKRLCRGGFAVPSRKRKSEPLLSSSPP